MKDDAVSIAPEIHKILFENDEVRVLDVVVEPHEKAALHEEIQQWVSCALKI